VWPTGTPGVRGRAGERERGSGEGSGDIIPPRWDNIPILHGIGDDLPRWDNIPRRGGVRRMPGCCRMNRIQMPVGVSAVMCAF